MKITHDLKVRMIPLDKIRVLNERRRGKDRFSEIVTSVANLGLKVPIVAAERPQKNGDLLYHTACGQGRYESFKVLGQAEIPAVIIDADDETLLLMSLVENLARRNRTSLEMAREIEAMKARGYKSAEIARKVDLDVSYVNAMLRLLRHGEERLVVAVENGRLPMSIALVIAESTDAEIQKAMVQAYEKGELKGKALYQARRLVEMRLARGKKPRGGPRRTEVVTADTLMQDYHKETIRQQMLIHRARECQGRLGFIVSAMKKLLADESLVNLLRAESLSTLPQYLAQYVHIAGESHAA